MWAALLRVLPLDDDDVEPLVRDRRGRVTAGGPGARHDDVVLVDAHTTCVVAPVAKLFVPDSVVCGTTREGKSAAAAQIRREENANGWTGE